MNAAIILRCPARSGGIQRTETWLKKKVLVDFQTHSGVVSTPIKVRICNIMDQRNLHLLIIAAIIWATYQAKIIEAPLKAISGKQCVASRHSEKTCCLRSTLKETGALMEHVP